MEAMPAVSSRSKKYPKSLLLVSLRDPRPIRHPDKCSKLENDATCGLERFLALPCRRAPILGNPFHYRMCPISRRWGSGRQSRGLTEQILLHPTHFVLTGVINVEPNYALKLRPQITVQDRELVQ